MVTKQTITGHSFLWCCFRPLFLDVGGVLTSLKLQCLLHAFCAMVALIDESLPVTSEVLGYDVSDLDEVTKMTQEPAPALRDQPLCGDSNQA